MRSVRASGNNVARKKARLERYMCGTGAHATRRDHMNITWVAIATRLLTGPSPMNTQDLGGDAPLFVNTGMLDITNTWTNYRGRASPGAMYIYYDS